MPEREAAKISSGAAAGPSAPIGELWKERYRIERELGRGGFGVVYLARDQQLHSKAVVLKVRREEGAPDPYFQKKFQQEIEALSRIDHPGVVGVLDAGQSPEGRPFLVMQFVEGETLRSAIPASGMDFARAALILRQVGQALGAAHDKGIYHRDLKPENIMLTRSGQNEEYVRLIDFGIAAVRDSEVVAQTQSRVMGTLCYMAPEQVMGKGSSSSDIYSLGVIAFEMLTGQRPEVTWEGVAKRPRELRPEIPESAQDTILTALSYQPEKRMMNPREFGDRIARALGAQTAAGTLRCEPLPSPAQAPIAQPSSAAGLEMAYVLFMDIVAYSKMKTDLQSRAITHLIEIVRNTPAYRRAQQSDQIISLPTGDGMALVFFQIPSSAIECASEISRELKKFPDIKLRMGVHTGPVHRVADINTNRNVAGGGINLAQRVMDCGDAGHILVSRAVADILGELSDWEPTLHDLGEAEVKHGVKVNVVNFYTDEVGNPAIPEKLRKSRALSVAGPPLPVPLPEAPALPAARSATLPQTVVLSPNLPATPTELPLAPQTTVRKTTGLVWGIGAVAVVFVVLAAAKFGPWNQRHPSNESNSTLGPTTGLEPASSQKSEAPAPGIAPPSGPPPSGPSASAGSSLEPGPGSSSSAAISRPASRPAKGSPESNQSQSPATPDKPAAVYPLREDEAKAAAQPKGTPSPETAPTSAASLPTPAERAELARARQRMVQLAARAEAISQSVHNLELQQGKQGVGLRGDMAAARSSMEYLIGQTETSMDSKDYEAANQSMDLAEPQIEKLEKFLGR